MNITKNTVESMKSFIKGVVLSSEDNADTKEKGLEILLTIAAETATVQHKVGPYILSNMDREAVINAMKDNCKLEAIKRFRAATAVQLVNQEWHNIDLATAKKIIEDFAVDQGIPLK